MVSTRLQSTSTTGIDNGTDYNAAGCSRTLRHATTSSEITPYTSLSSPPISTQPPPSTTKFLDLPTLCMDKIFSYLGYKTVSQLRLVCKQMDRVCSAILNSTFQKLQTQMLHRFQGIKAKMPRRESARRNHPLACESNIVETLHMRLTLLQMSFGKHIERKHICFFAGDILDEVYRILHYIKVTPKVARPYKVTDELFDLSTMAMEYFKEHIEPTLPEIAYFGTDFLEFSSSSNKYMSLDSPPHGGAGAWKGEESPNANRTEERTQSPQQGNLILRKRIRKIKQGMKRYNYQLSQLRKELRCCRGKVGDQQKQIVEYANRLDEYDKKTEESNRKFSTMLQELNKCKTELQYWRSKSPLTLICASCGQVTATLPEHTHLDVIPPMPELEPAPGWVPVPSTSTCEDVWNRIDPFQTAPTPAPVEQRNKRKPSTTEKAMGTPPNKKRNVLKSRPPPPLLLFGSINIEQPFIYY